MNEAQYVRTKELLSADVGDELVALDADAGHCYGFNNVAASVWRELAEPRSFNGLKLSLMNEYEVSEEQCAADLSELLDDFVSKGLIRRT